MDIDEKLDSGFAALHRRLDVMDDKNGERLRSIETTMAGVVNQVDTNEKNIDKIDKRVDDVNGRVNTWNFGNSVLGAIAMIAAGLGLTK